MKKLLFAGLVFLAISACSHDVVTESQTGEPIAFQATVETKGTEINSSTLERFYAKSVIYTESLQNPDVFFEEAEFARIGDWFYSNPTYYWPQVSNVALAFLFWSPSAEEMGMTVTSAEELFIEGSGAQYKDVKPKLRISDQIDFLVSAALGNNEVGIVGSSNGGIQLQHAFSQIEIKAKNSDQNTIYKVAGVKLANLYGEADMKASLNLSTNKVESSALNLREKTTYIDVFEDNPVIVQNYSSSIMNPEGGNAFVIPQTIERWDPDADPTNPAKGAYVSVKLQVIQNGQVVFPSTGEGYGWRAIPIWTGSDFDTWEYANKYHYTLDFSTGSGYPDPAEPGAGEIVNNGVSFSTGIGNWNDKSDSQATNEQIIGHWVGQKAHRIYYYKDNEPEETTYDTPEDVKDFLNTFYDFVITDDTTIKIKDANGEYSIESAFFLEDNYFYLDAVKNPYDGEYQFLPYIEDIGDDYVVIKIVYEWNDDREIQTIYFTKSKLPE